jgi:hypothetical protein
MKNALRIHIIVYLIAWIFVYAPGNVGAVNGTNITARELINEIKQNGEVVVLRKIISNDSLYATLIEQVEHASPEWIEIAVRLISHADAGFASELDSALSLALSKRPARVLTGLDEQYIKAVCSAPFLIDYPDFKSGLKILKRTKVMLLKLEANNLDNKKKICLTQVSIMIDKFNNGQFDDLPGH